MTEQQARNQLQSLSLNDVTGNLVTVAERFLALWAGDAASAKVSLIKLGIDGQLAHMLRVAIDSAERRRQRQLNYELDGYRVRRTSFRVA